MLGRFNLNDTSENGSVTSMVMEIRIHDEWSRHDASLHSDLAIVVMTDSVKFSDTIQPVSLPEQSYNNPEQKYKEFNGVGNVVGWGRSEFKELDDVSAIKDFFCFLNFKTVERHAGEIDRFFCAGNENKSKECAFDRGGGFYHKNSPKSPWLVNGVASGPDVDPEHGCEINKYQLYTNVARYIDWITKVMKETKETVWKYVDFNCQFYVG